MRVAVHTGDPLRGLLVAHGMCRSAMSDHFVYFTATASLLFGTGTAYSDEATQPLRLYQTTGVNTVRSVEVARINDGIVVTGTIWKRFNSRHIGFEHIHIGLLDRAGSGWKGADFGTY